MAILLVISISLVSGTESIVANYTATANSPSSCSPTLYRGDAFSVYTSGNVTKLQAWFNFSTVHNVTVIIQNITTCVKHDGVDNFSPLPFTRYFYAIIELSF